MKEENFLQEEKLYLKKQEKESSTENSYTDWFVFRDQNIFGPMSSAQILTYLDNDFLSQKHHVWCSDYDDWKNISDVKSFENRGPKDDKKTILDQKFKEIYLSDSTKKMIELTDGPVLIEDQNQSKDEAIKEDKNKKNRTKKNIYCLFGIVFAFSVLALLMNLNSILDRLN